MPSPREIANLPRVILLGTSGWSYAHWRGLLYPEGLPTRRWLPRYAQVFRTVELNATFYKLPTEQAVDRWRDEVPNGFVFAAKGSRYLTHVKRLKETGLGIERYFRLVRRLGPKLGPILWQLPPQMAKLDLDRLEGFLAHLPRDLRHAFEFRSAAWYTTATCDLLDAYGAAFCEHDLVDEKPPRHTGGFRYLRFHGSSRASGGGKYRGRYGRAALTPVARSLRRGHQDAYVYFNNDLGGHALLDAIELSELLGDEQPRTAWEQAEI